MEQAYKKIKRVQAMHGLSKSVGKSRSFVSQRRRRYQAFASVAPLSRGGATYSRSMSPFEKKNIDTTLSSATTGFPAVGVATGVLSLLNGCTAGGLPTNRVGRRITMTSLYMRGTIQLTATSTGNCPVRILIVYDKQTNKAAPSATDILNTDNAASLMLLANNHRFRVIRDIIVPIIGTGGPQGCYIDEYVKLPNLTTEYIDGAGAGTVGDITSGGLFALIYCNNTIGTTACLSGLNLRLRFQDA